MKYKITIQKLRPRKEIDSYDSYDDLYEQIVEDDLDIQTLIIAINSRKKI